jgi:hypothetical protein
MVILSEKKVCFFRKKISFAKRSHIGDLCLSLPQEFVNQRESVVYDYDEKIA